MPLNPELAQSLQAMEYWIEEFAESPHTHWMYTKEGVRRDVVTGMTDVYIPKGPGNPRERRLCVTQWLGREAAWGGVAYGARDLEQGPLIVWQPGAKESEDVGFYDPRTLRTLPDEPGLAAELATLLPGGLSMDRFSESSQPLFNKSKFQTFLDYLFEASMLRQSET